MYTLNYGAGQFFLPLWLTEQWITAKNDEEFNNKWRNTMEELADLQIGQISSDTKSRDT